MKKELIDLYALQNRQYILTLIRLKYFCLPVWSAQVFSHAIFHGNCGWHGVKFVIRFMFDFFGIQSVIFVYKICPGYCFLDHINVGTTDKSEQGGCNTSTLKRIRVKRYTVESRYKQLFRQQQNVAYIEILLISRL